jgi:hypothetical protein
VFPNKQILVLDFDAKFRTLQDAKAEPAKVAAANWAATGWLISQIKKNCVVIDVGSTTTTIEDFYVTVGGNTTTQHVTSQNVISVGDKKEFCFGTAEDPAGFAWVFSETYDIKVVTDNGFSVDGTYFSPAQ